MKTYIKNLAVFVCICSVITLLLAATNFITAPVIEENQNAAANAALLQVMPEGKGFETADISTFSLPATVTEVHKETSGLGYVVKLTTAGYGSDFVIMCGVNSDGVVTGAVCLSSNETLSKEKTYGENFTDKDAAGVEAVDTISGATKTTEAYKNAVKDALNAAIILGGGSVDIRTEEEILADNLDAAFPAGEKAFEKLFMVDLIEGVDAVYEATNKAGYVFVSGEQFIGVNADGTVVTEGVTDTALYSDAVAAIKASTLEDIDISAYEGLEKTVVSAKKTASGNFVLETKGAGYGIKGGDEYHPASGEYIIVRVSVTPDFRIIDCLTVSEAETDGLGDACADESFYSQFVGKTDENYKEIDAISGATLTTNGYTQAIERAFSAITTMNGGAR
ncbi:MAG: FMN-binding protein [Clostridia bacterium]|nr:FMN-binding protein [Clostridia bacterium]